VPHLVGSLEAEDATLRGLAAWAIGMIGAHEARSRITPLVRDDRVVEVYLDRKMRVCRVRDLAEEALGKLER
jgi:HEAT repeat protein